MCNNAKSCWLIEEWALIREQPGYSVSNRGLVRNDGTGRVLKNRMCGRNGEQYATVLLGGRNYAVHRLVAQYFIGPRPEGKQVNHKDSDKMNPCLTNLEYVTPQENSQHGYDHGKHVPLAGEKNPAAKLTDLQVGAIRSLYIPYKYGTVRLAKEFGVSQAAVWKIVKGLCWKEA